MCSFEVHFVFLAQKMSAWEGGKNAKFSYRLDYRKGPMSSEHCTKRLYQVQCYELLSIQCSEHRVMGT